ncbi:MAG: prolipoprotein diacylglyceryl transferase [Candidatus Omnitrophota bacterium]
MHPILVRIGPITIYSYGVFVAAAFLLSSIFVLRKAPAFGIPKDDIWDLLLFILIFGMVGARLLHVLLNIGYYKENLLEMVMFHKGGLAIHGAIISAVGAALIVLLKKRLSFWKSGDLIMLYLPFGQAIGRIGCFFNGCCYGRDGHPTQIYSSIALIFIFVALQAVYKKFKRFDGDIFLLYFLFYCPVRFSIDFLRGDLMPVFRGLTTSQLLNISIFVAAFSVYIFKSIRAKRGQDGKISL